MVKRGLVLAALASGCGDDARPLVEVIAHTNAAIAAPGVEIVGYDAAGVIVDDASTDGDGVAWLDVPEGGAVGSAVETVTGVSVGDRIVLGPTFRRASDRALDVVVAPEPAGVTGTDDAAGCGGSIASYVPCPGPDVTDVLVLGHGPTPAAYAYALAADPAETITVGPWRTDARAVSLAYVDPLADGQAFTVRLFAASAHTYAELGVDAIDVDAHVISGSLPTAFLVDSGAWAGVIGGILDNGAERLRYQLVDGPLEDEVIADTDLPPWLDAVQWNGDEVTWDPPADVSAFDVLTIRATGDADDVLLVLPPDTTPPIVLAAAGTSVTLTYEGYDTVDGYDDVKARGYDAVSLAPMLDRAREGVMTYSWNARR